MSVMYIRNADTGKFEPVKALKGDKGDPGTIENVTITSIDGLEEALDGKLGTNETAADAVKLDGRNADQYALKTDIPDEYTLPTATVDVLGGVKVGNGLQIDANGVLSLALSNASGVSF